MTPFILLSLAAAALAAPQVQKELIVIKENYKNRRWKKGKVAQSDPNHTSCRPV